MCNEWYVYLLKCHDDSLYCGITTDLKRRIYEHNNTKKASKYVRSRRPAHLVFYENSHTRSTALSREREIKGMKKSDKISLIKSAVNLNKNDYD